MLDTTIPFPLWEGFTPAKTEQHTDSLTIHLTPTRHPICLCGSVSAEVHDTSIRTVSDRNIMEYAVTLKVPVRRLCCFRCGVITESISWLEPYSRQTKRLISFVESLLPKLPIKHISELVKLHWTTVRIPAIMIEDSVFIRSPFYLLFLYPYF